VSAVSALCSVGTVGPLVKRVILSV